MSIFAIKVYEFGLGDRFYTCKDERLWGWLNAEDVFLGLRPGEVTPPFLEESLRVLSPEGFVFYDNILAPLESDAALNPADPSYLSDWGYVSDKHPETDMAFMLIINPYDYATEVTEDEFLELNLGEDRIFETTVW